MQKLRYFFFFILFIGSFTNSQGQKFDKWSIPNVKPDTNKYQMPSPDIKLDQWSLPNVFPDSNKYQNPSHDIRGAHHETGLTLSPQKDEIYDPETGYVFNTETFKIYKRKDQLSKKKEE